MSRTPSGPEPGRGAADAVMAALPRAGQGSPALKNHFNLPYVFFQIHADPNPFPPAVCRRRGSDYAASLDPNSSEQLYLHSHT